NIEFAAEKNIDAICSAIEKTKPALAIIDSIQTMNSQEAGPDVGSINQIRICTAKLMAAAKNSNVPVFIIGHVTKDGAVAGPKMLEHLVDTVIYFEGENEYGFRLLKTVKNRFGSTNEVGVFSMTEKGLSEVTNPEKFFLNRSDKTLPGSAITLLIEGSRAFAVEIQALLTKSSFGYPQRKSFGFDLNRLILLSAVLTKRLGLKLFEYDIHLNVAGGLKITETAADLAAVLAIVSALKNKPLKDTAAFGEVGLLGEVRCVSQTDRRVKEAQKLGFEKIILPKGHSSPGGKNIVEIENISEIENLF
ncbi:DNA repair protein RadA, partial [Candidatus Parcubacteria bacterium]